VRAYSGGENICFSFGVLVLPSLGGICPGEDGLSVTKASETASLRHAFSFTVTGAGGAPVAVVVAVSHETRRCA
jgi:hypothetical protein